jgi:hypothetical protein
MTRLFKERMTVEIEGEFVVYLIGMRVNNWWKIHKWFPVFLAMPRMLKELASDPDSGMLGFRLLNLFTVLQYWRSLDHLIAYARQKERAHLPAWRAFNKAIGMGDSDVGIWHETYRIQPGNYEVIYRNMPAFGLGAAFGLVPVSKNRESAYERLAHKKENVEVNMA